MSPLAKQGAITVARAIVEALEGDYVVLTVGDERVKLPSALLPDGIPVGGWVELRIKELPPPPLDGNT